MRLTCIALVFKEKLLAPAGKCALGKTWAAVVSAGSGDTSSGTRPPQTFSFVQRI